MTSLLARLGQVESRIAQTSIWRSGKRKRESSSGGGGGVCWTCRAQRTRGYADDALRIPSGSYLFPPRSEIEEVDKPYQRPTKGWRFGRAQLTHKNDERSDSEGFKTSTSLDDVHLKADQRESAQDLLWESFEGLEDASESADATNAAIGTDDFKVDTQAPAYAQHRDSLLLTLDYAAVLPGAVAASSSDVIARCLLAASSANDLNFLRAIPQEMFSQIILCLEPANSVDSIVSTHLEVSGALAKHFGIMSLQAIAWDYSQLLSEVLGIRKSAGIGLTIGDIAVLLRSARDLGNRRLAIRVWHRMQEDGVQPDVDCWNNYMGAVTFNQQLDADSRYKHRVTTFNTMARKVEAPGRAFRAYRTGGGGVKDRVMSLFPKMLQSGAVANEESFRIVITAAAREGDLATVKAVLRRVWGIDVDAVLQPPSADGADTPVPKDMELDSPLYPTSNLLFTLAHAFSINNAIPHALRLVDFVARQYSLTISPEVWSHLFEWTFVLALPRSGTDRKDTVRNDVGTLPKQSLQALWTTMTGPPYDIQPTIGMINRMVRNLQTLNAPERMLPLMERGRKMYMTSYLDARAKLAQLQDIATDRVSHGEAEKRRQEFEVAELVRKRDLFWCKRWVRLMLSTLNKRSSEDVSLRILPAFLLEWEGLCPQIVKYEIAGGQIEITMHGAASRQMNKKSVQARRVRNSQVLETVPRIVGEDWFKPHVGEQRMEVDNGAHSA